MLFLTALQTLLNLFLLALLLRFRREWILENLALRLQILAYRRQGRTPRIMRLDRVFWSLLCRFWKHWQNACLFVKPETVIRWHRLGFKLFWRWKSRGSVGRPKVETKVRDLIRRMAFENPFWGAPRIHAELVKLGIHLCERSVQRWIPKRPLDPKRVQNWRNFLDNHREVLSAMDFMVVPTWDFKLLYVLVILDHGRRIIRHFNVTSHPTAEWLKQQLREAFPFDDTPKYLIFDRDTTFGAVKGFIESMGIKPKVTSYHCPWQNGHVSYCTSFGRFGWTWVNGNALGQFTPLNLHGCAFR